MYCLDFVKEDRERKPHWPNWQCANKRIAVITIPFLRHPTLGFFGICWVCCHSFANLYKYVGAQHILYCTRTRIKEWRAWNKKSVMFSTMKEREREWMFGGSKTMEIAYYIVNITIISHDMTWHDICDSWTSILHCLFSRSSDRSTIKFILPLAKNGDWIVLTVCCGQRV